MPFQPGNKHGRGRPPAGRSLSEALRVALKEKLPDGRTKYRAVADVLVHKALSGDVSAIREILDRTEGKVSSAQAMAEQRPVQLNLLPMDLAAM